MPTANVNDTTLHYRSHQASKTSGCTLVLVHGFGASGETWNDIVPALRAHCDLIQVDLKGFGFSAKPRDSDYTLHEQAELMTEFVSFLAADKIVLVGHSYGGAVAVLAYLKLRDRKLASRIQGLVLIDSASYVQSLPFFIASLKNPVIRGLTQILTTAEWRIRYVLRKLFVDHERLDRNRVERYACFLRLPDAERALARVAAGLPPPDAEHLSSLFATIDVPTQILWGAQDPVIPVAQAYRLNRDIAGSALAVIPYSGHVPHEECPDVAAAVILRFLEDLQS